MNEDKNVFKFPSIKPKSDDQVVQEALTSSLEQFKIFIEGGAKGFATVVMTADGTPAFILSGDVDPLQMLGALDVFKLNVAAQLVHIEDPEDH